VTTTAAPATYRSVLRRREMPAILTAHAISLTGSVAAEVALSVLIFHRTSSPLLSSLTLACAFVPQAFSALLLSGFADRFPPRRLLVACDLLCALLIAGMVVPGTPVAVLLLLAAGTGVLTPLFGGARAAALADVLDDASWVLARSMLRIISQTALLAGFALGGLALAVVGSRTLLVADVVSFVGSALLLRFGTSERPARGSKAPQQVRAGLRATAVVLRQAPLRRLLLMTWLPSAAVSSLDALATPYASGLQHGATAIGLLLAAAALGSILGELLGVRLRIAERPQLVVPVACLTGLGLGLYAFHPPMAVAIGLNVLACLGGAIGQSLDQQLLTQLPEQLRGHVLSLQNGLLMGIQGVAIALAGALAEVVPTHQVLAVAGVLDLLCIASLLRPRALP
jgi:Na+/melibiose symporter-like transporter